MTVNPGLIINEFPLPITEELFADLSICRFFKNLNCSLAYLQLPVDEVSTYVLTINTHRGLYRVKQMMFGIALAPAIWQEHMSYLFRNIKGVGAFQDDIHIAASNLEELKYLINRVLKVLDN